MALSALVVIVCIIFASYLLFRRRSSKLPPGPVGIPFLGSLPALLLSKRVMHGVFTSWSKTYGPVFSVRLGSLTAVILNDFHSMKEALAHPDLQDRPFLDYMLAVPGEGLATASGRVWLHQRKFAVNIFRNFGIGRASFEDTLREEAGHLVAAVIAKDGKSFDPEYLINNAVSNVICLVIHGRRFAYDDANFQTILKAFKRNMELGLITGISTMIPFLKYFPLGAVKEIIQNVKVIEKFTKALTDGHKPKLDEDNVRDFTDAFLIEMSNAKQKRTEDVFNDQNLLWVIGDLFAAGTETNTNTIRHALMYLLNDTAIKVRLQAELDSVVGRERTPRLSDRPSLPYTEAFIAECLRKTLSTITLAHVASKSVEMFGFTIPKGAMIVPNMNSIMTDEKIWAQPEVFRPERFLKDGKFSKPDEFIPFGIGRRVCLGEQFAMMELFIFITTLLHRFDFLISEKKGPPSLKCAVGFTVKPLPFEMHFIERV